MDERQEALGHALNLSVGHEEELLLPLLKNPQLADSLAEAILADALNGPLTYQIQLYFEALKQRKDPALQQMIREHLAFLTDGEDLGPEPSAWKETVDRSKLNLRAN
jgi:hypothetical protein